MAAKKFDSLKARLNRAKGQRAIQESWGGHSQDENQYRRRPPRQSHS